ncbi:sialate O-acetylesterase [Paenibacillus rhizovicinus]|uniref:Sialate O-acetylesterase n=1 Tax=Paenibacillus rhizovicinus TaxID=2704463 RepID=A0A6C0P688_9BACL|nr:sialate O-acetylesterase [Paenibacillus rhizovicinus]QHW33836.1 sialate O-acetylesterase [Paenibacillus rhizovicinus]
MGNEQIGVMIKQGPQSWGIIQQVNGTASIAMSGIWSANEACKSPQVYARVVREDSAEMIVAWVAAEMGEGQAWTIRLDHVPAGGLYRIETCLQIANAEPEGERSVVGLEWAMRGDMIHHVGVGDLWVIAGQSNAAGYGKGPVNDPPEMGIHLLRNNGNWDLATHPFNESTNTIHIENREGGNPGHSPFLAFARMIKRKTGYPVGLVQTALGGSPLRSWNPQEEGTLYRNMVNIVQSVGGTVKGVLWYQGCSDCNPEECHTYGERFGAMVSEWRRDLQDAGLPFITVQLNRHTASPAMNDAEADRSWGTLREQQRTAALMMDHVTVVPAIDCPLSDEIHNSPAGNLLIGERMARAALATVYGQNLHYRAPIISNARLSSDAAGGTTVELEFGDVGGYLLHTGPSQSVFTLEDEDGNVDVLEWYISGKDTIHIKPGRPLQGQLYVNGAYERNPAAYFPLDSLTYMPVLSFYHFPVH